MESPRCPRKGEAAAAVAGPSEWGSSRPTPNRSGEEGQGLLWRDGEVPKVANSMGCAEETPGLRTEAWHSRVPQDSPTDSRGFGL